VENSQNVDRKHIENQQIIDEPFNKYFTAIVENFRKDDY
jgi:hypothetical protein